MLHKSNINILFSGLVFEFLPRQRGLFRQKFISQTMLNPSLTNIAHYLTLLVIVCSFFDSKHAYAQEMKLQTSPYCVSVRGGRLIDGAALTQWHCHGGTDQQWRFVSNRIQLAGSNKCLSVRNEDVSPGREVVMWECHGGADQRWILTSEGTIQNSSRPDLCLSTFNGAVALDAGLAVWNCHGEHDQRWSLNGVRLPVPEFTVSDFRRSHRFINGAWQFGIEVTIRNGGAAAGRTSSVTCSEPGRSLTLLVQQVVASNSSSPIFLRFEPSATRVYCGVSGSGLDGLPESVRFNNTLVKYLSH